MYLIERISHEMDKENNAKVMSASDIDETLKEALMRLLCFICPTRFQSS